MIAYLNVDEVIRIIRKEDEPKPALMLPQMQTSKNWSCAPRRPTRP